jgi:hypothetical protein
MLTSAQTYTFINPAITSGYFETPRGKMASNDLQVKATYRDHRRDQIAVAYQYGHATDNSISDFAISAHSQTSTNPFNLDYDRGPSTSDIRHALNISGTVPLLWGVDLAPIFTFQSGAPYTATTNTQTPGTALAPESCLSYFSKCYPAGFGRNSLRGANTYGLNARLSKRIRFAETSSVSFFFEAYNIPSWRNRGTGFFTNVDVTTGASAFGMPTNGSNTLRQVQVGARVDF